MRDFKTGDKVIVREDSRHSFQRKSYGEQTILAVNTCGPNANSEDYTIKTNHAVYRIEDLEFALGFDTKEPKFKDNEYVKIVASGKGCKSSMIGTIVQILSIGSYKDGIGYRFKGGVNKVYNNYFGESSFEKIEPKEFPKPISKDELNPDDFTWGLKEPKIYEPKAGDKVEFITKNPRSTCFKIGSILKVLKTYGSGFIIVRMWDQSDSSTNNITQNCDGKQVRLVGSSVELRKYLPEDRVRLVSNEPMKSNFSVGNILRVHDVYSSGNVVIKPLTHDSFQQASVVHPEQLECICHEQKSKETKFVLGKFPVPKRDCKPKYDPYGHNIKETKLEIVEIKSRIVKPKTRFVKGATNNKGSIVPMLATKVRSK